MELEIMKVNLIYLFILSIRRFYNITKNFLFLNLFYQKIGQIAKNLVKRQTISMAIDELKKKTTNQDIKNFISSYINQHDCYADKLINPVNKKLSQLNENEIVLIMNHYSNNITLNQSLYTSNRAQLNSKTFHSYSYAKKSNFLNCYTIEFKDSSSKTYYGNLNKFISIKNEIKCLVNLFRIIEDKHITRNDQFLRNFYKFYKPVELTCSNHILRRCILIEYRTELIITPCLDLNEHD